MASARIVGKSEGSPVRVGCEVRALRQDFVAVAFELEFALNGRRHQTHHVRERGHLEIRAPRLFGDRGAADDVAPLEHRDSRAALGQESGRDEAVVPAADHDHVEGFVRHSRRL